MSDEGNREQIENAAARIIEAMPNLPQRDHLPALIRRRVSAYWAWMENVKQWTEGNDALAQRVREMKFERMGVDEDSPAADLNALDLIDAGLGDILVTERAAAVMDGAGYDRQGGISYLLEQYITYRRQTGGEIFKYNDTRTKQSFCVGLEGRDWNADATNPLAVSIWIEGEPGMPTVSSSGEHRRQVDQEVTLSHGQYRLPDDEDEKNS